MLSGEGERRRRWWGVIAALGLVVVACSGGGDGRSSGDGQAEPGAEPADGDGGASLPRLHAVRGERPGIFDEQGRQVVLRGINLNSLAEYARANPDFEPVRPVTGDDWDAMAAEGFNVVRLLVSWSRLEPERGRIDESYVEEIRDAVRDAAAREMYTVIDMHQDAWGPHVATPEAVDCPPGTEPSTGWDGAPAWATPEAGANSCRPVGGEAKPDSPLEWHEIVGRPYPRAAPGRITALDVDPTAGTLALRAEDADAGSTLDLWVPEAEPVVGGNGIAEVESRRVPGGWRVTAKTCAAVYEVTIVPGHGEDSEAQANAPPARCGDG